MSCEYCRGEAPLVSYRMKDLGGIDFDAKIVHGFLLGVRVSSVNEHLGGASVEINYCPKCGAPTCLREK